MGQKQTFRTVNCDVCFTSNADIHERERHVRFGPKADIAPHSITPAATRALDGTF
jgi:hypothetical protein